MKRNPPGGRKLQAARGRSPGPEKKEKKKKGFDLAEIKRLEEERKARRKGAAEQVGEREAKAQKYIDMGITGDTDYLELIADWKGKNRLRRSPHTVIDEKIIVAIRKRPLNSSEMGRHEQDSVSCANPFVVVHEPKESVSKQKDLNNVPFRFDHVFGTESTTDEVYDSVCAPLVNFAVKGGYASCFAYGQTGSGKTYTMGQLQKMAIKDLIALAGDDVVTVSFIEIYSGRIHDLLNESARLEILEDAKGKVVIVGMLKEPVTSPEEAMEVIETGAGLRKTSKTDANSESSRSHAIVQFMIHSQKDDGLGWEDKKARGVLSIIDLAGSERGQDTKSHTRQLRTEGAEINKSLLALKECIRSLQQKETSAVSFRGSKLTQVMKASFVEKKVRTVMIVTVSPASDSTNHTISSLRYADRIKDKYHKKTLVLPLLKEGEEPIQEYRKQSESTALEFKGDEEGENFYTHQPEPEAEPQTTDDADEHAEQLDNHNDAVVELANNQDQLVLMHIATVEQNSKMCVDEAKLLSEVVGPTAVDVDIDAYTINLEQILIERIEQATALQKKLVTFRRSLAHEDATSRRISYPR